MPGIEEILTGLEDVETDNEDQVKNDIYSNLLRLYKFAGQEEAAAEERVESILSTHTNDQREAYPLEGLEENWERNHDSFDEKIAYADALGHLQRSNSLSAFVGRMRRGFELHEGWKKDVLKMIDDPDYESPLGRESAEEVSRESVEEISNGYEIALKTAIEPVVEQYDLV